MSVSDYYAFQTVSLNQSSAPILLGRARLRLAVFSAAHILKQLYFQKSNKLQILTVLSFRFGNLYETVYKISAYTCIICHYLKLLLK